MPTEDYHHTLNRITREIRTASLNASEPLHRKLMGVLAELEAILVSGKTIRAIDVQLRDGVLAVLSEFAASQSTELAQTVTGLSTDIATRKEAATNALLRESGIPNRVSFGTVPLSIAERYQQIVDTEGFKAKPSEWAQRHANRITRLAGNAKARQRAVDDLARELARLVLSGQSKFEGVTGLSVEAKLKTLHRSEVASSGWETNRQTAEASPIVYGISWNLSPRHPQWDVCDILAKSNLYGLGEGIYPPERLPDKPHPNDLCFQTEVLRPVSQWADPSANVGGVDLNAVSMVDAIGTDRHKETQTAAAMTVIQSAIQRTSG